MHLTHLLESSKVLQLTGVSFQCFIYPYPYDWDGSKVAYSKLIFSGLWAPLILHDCDSWVPSSHATRGHICNPMFQQFIGSNVYMESHPSRARRHCPCRQTSRVLYPPSVVSKIAKTLIRDCFQGQTFSWSSVHKFSSGCGCVLLILESDWTLCWR